jgi:uncharacterized protein (TIGR00251 family)
MDWFRLDAQRNVLTLHLYVQPNARSTCVSGLHDSALKVRVAAPAVNDKANNLLADFIGGLLDLPANRVIIAGGLHSRKKKVQITHPAPSVVTSLRKLIL